MHVPMRNLLRICFAYIDDLNIELEIESGKGMIGIDADFIAHDGNDGCHAEALWSLCLETHSGNEVHPFRELVAVGFSHKLRNMFPVCVGCRDDFRDFIAGCFPLQRFLQPWYDIAMPMQVGQGLTPVTGVKDLSLDGGQLIVHGDDSVIFYLHAPETRHLNDGVARNNPVL